MGLKKRILFSPKFRNIRETRFPTKEVVENIALAPEPEVPEQVETETPVLEAAQEELEAASEPVVEIVEPPTPVEEPEPVKATAKPKRKPTTTRKKRTSRRKTTAKTTSA